MGEILVLVLRLSIPAVSVMEEPRRFCYAVYVMQDTRIFMKEPNFRIPVRHNPSWLEEELYLIATRSK